jgi:hypothetical protein
VLNARPNAESFIGSIDLKSENRNRKQQRSFQNPLGGGLGSIFAALVFFPTSSQSHRHSLITLLFPTKNRNLKKNNSVGQDLVNFKSEDEIVNFHRSERAK